MDYALENQNYRATISSHGAELLSLLYKGTQTEFLWQADTKFWGRHSPVLFPVVGRLNQDRYRIGTEIYPLSQHGFARDHQFVCTTQHVDRIIFTLDANEKTLQIYPFPFQLTISYELGDTALTIGYRVDNHHSEVMPFSIGGHPGFRCPVLPNTSFNEYYLEFSQPETLCRHYLEQGLFNGRTESVLNDQTRLPLRHDLFVDDALVFKQPKSDAVHLGHQAKGPVLTVSFPGFEYLGIWTKPDQGANFVCIEPWHGIADSQGYDGELQDKEGIHLLPPQKSFACSYTIHIHPQALTSAT